MKKATDLDDNEPMERRLTPGEEKRIHPIKFMKRLEKFC